MTAGADIPSTGPAVSEPVEAPDSRLGRRGWTARKIAIAVVAAAFVVWLVIKAADDTRQFAVVTLNGLTLAGLFFVVALCRAAARGDTSQVAPQQLPRRRPRQRRIANRHELRDLERLKAPRDVLL